MRTLIVEDIRKTSEVIKNRVRKMAMDVLVIDQAFNGEEAYTMLVEKEYDLVFLDIQLPHGTSFDLLKELKKRDQINFEIIFITGQKESEFIMQAIKFSAIDYLLKPIEDEPLLAAIDKARNKLKLIKQNDQVELLLDIVDDKSKGNKVAFQLTKGVIKFFKLDDVSHLVADSTVTRIITTNGQEHIAIKNLGYYKKFLISQYDFQPISQSIIINMNQLEDYDHNSLSVRLKNGMQLTASRRGGTEFRKLLESTLVKGSSLKTKIKRLFG